MRPTLKTLLAPLVLVSALLMSACGGTADSQSGDGSGASTKLSLVALDAEGGLRRDHPGVYEDAGRQGREVQPGASGDQARAVIAGLPTDIAALSLEPDISKLVKAKLVGADWIATPTKGIVSHSIVVIGVRPGNPKEHQGLGGPRQARR